MHRNQQLSASRGRFHLIGLSLLLVTIAVAAEYRTMDGSNNNVANPTWGMAGTIQLSSNTNSYADGKETFRADLPNPRNVSNLLFGIASKRLLTLDGNSDVTTFWGQFLDHDIVKTPGNASDPAMIPIPACDQWFDPECSGTKTIGFYRSKRHYSAEGARQQFNMITSFIDASQVYASDDVWARDLRTLKGGKLLTSENNLLPLNKFAYPMDNPVHRNPQTLFFAGDSRASENPALSSLHTLFLREHNRLCDEFAKANPSWDDEKLYQEARNYVAAYMQVIFEMEYVPAILGEPLPPYKGYDPKVNPTIHSFFSSVAFRYGHSEVNTVIRRIGPNGIDDPLGPILLRDGFFNPTHVMQGGIDSILRGISQQYQQRIDTQFVDDIRNFLFNIPGFVGLDLAATNIWRGRDHGALLYNDARAYYGLPRRKSFSEITKDSDIAALLEDVYGSIDNIDSYVGGLAEDASPPSVLGELFTVAVREQYVRLRDGDRFWYENIFSGKTLESLKNTRLSDIILRNTNIKPGEIQKNVFTVSAPSPVGEAPSPNQYMDANGQIRVLNFDLTGQDYFSATLLGGRYVMYWKIVQDTFLEVALKVKTTGWVGFGINTSGEMKGADMVIAWVTGSGAVVKDYYSRAFVEPRPDSAFGGTEDLLAAIAQEEDGYTTVKFVRRLNGTDQYDHNIRRSPMQLLVALGSEDSFGQHAREDRAQGEVDFFTGSVSVSSNIFLEVHAILAGFVYSMNSVIAVFIARYMRRTFHMWKEIHVVMQIIAFLGAFTAAGLLFYRLGDRIVTPHALFGLLTLLLTLFQAFRGVDMKSRKRDNYFASDRTHKWNGLFTTIMQFVTVYLGLELLQPKRAYFYFYYAFTAGFWSLSIYKEFAKKRKLNRAVKHVQKSRSKIVA
eukprot:TRINITY_DN1045_c0_g1_i3.p1 TRINITY_DN1045_c0_g1~~TRINITY_DN1045_c0_g1_i3.p1  ORF type:complete len:897 (-),score=167.81 TRINITY_DN1045_c0_g1_i3:104-2794(-)